jgi:hypothetical protein
MRAKISARSKSLWQDPAYAEKTTAAIRAAAAKRAKPRAPQQQGAAAQPAAAGSSSSSSASTPRARAPRSRAAAGTSTAEEPPPLPPQQQQQQQQPVLPRLTKKVGHVKHLPPLHRNDATALALLVWLLVLLVPCYAGGAEVCSQACRVLAVTLHACGA